MFGDSRIDDKLIEVKPVELLGSYRKCYSRKCSNPANLYMVWNEPIAVCLWCAARWLEIGEAMAYQVPRLTLQALRLDQIIRSRS